MYCSLSIHSTRPNSQPSLLCGNNEAVLRRCEEKKFNLSPNHLILHYDNAQAYKALFSRSFWPKNRLLKWNTHPISLDFWLFPKRNSDLKERIFQDIEYINKCDKGTGSYSITGVPQVFQTAASSLG
jgi:hypothetical protein